MRQRIRRKGLLPLLAGMAFCGMLDTAHAQSSGNAKLDDLQALADRYDRSSSPAATADTAVHPAANVAAQIQSAPRSTAAPRLKPSASFKHAANISGSSGEVAMSHAATGAQKLPTAIAAQKLPAFSAAQVAPSRSDVAIEVSQKAPIDAKPDPTGGAADRRLVHSTQAKLAQARSSKHAATLDDEDAVLPIDASSTSESTTPTTFSPATSAPMSTPATSMFQSFATGSAAPQSVPVVPPPGPNPTGLIVGNNGVVGTVTQLLGATGNSLFGNSSGYVTNGSLQVTSSNFTQGYSVVSVLGLPVVNLTPVGTLLQTVGGTVVGGTGINSHLTLIGGVTSNSYIDNINNGAAGGLLGVVLPTNAPAWASTCANVLGLITASCWGVNAAQDNQVLMGDGASANGSDEVVIGTNASHTLPTVDACTAFPGGSPNDPNNPCGVPTADYEARLGHSVVIGDSASGTANGQTILGAGATSNQPNSVALGYQSNAARGPQANYVAFGLTAPQNSAGEVSIGSPGQERQITNVAAGSAGTDAVNVNQLQASVIAATGDSVQYDDTTKATVTLAGPASTDGGVTGGTTISNLHQGALSATSTDAVNGSQLFATNTEVGVIGAQATSLGNAIASDLGGNSSYTAAGGLVAPAYTTYNTDGTTSTVNSVGAVIDSINSKGINYFHVNSTGADSKATGIDSVAVGPNALASNADDVALGANSITSATTAVSGATIGGTAYLFAGATPTAAFSVGGRQIQNVAAGQLNGTSTDAVNGSQLYATNEAVNTLSQTTSADDKGSVKYAVNTDGTPNYASVALAGIASTDGGVTGGTTVTNLHQGAVNATSTDAINGAQLYGVAGDTSTTYITNNGAGVKYVRTNDTGLAAGDAHAQAVGSSALGYNATTATTAIDGLALGNGATANNQNDVALGAGSITAAAVATTGDTIYHTAYTYAGSAPTSTVSVGSAGNERTITNVAAGRVSATSTDAVNGSQLYATNQAVNTIGNDITTINNGGGIRFFRVNAPATAADSVASGSDSIAIGPDSVASGDSSYAVGNGAQASGVDSVAIGHGSSAAGGSAIAIGAGNTAFGAGAVAIGDPSYASGTGAFTGGANNIANSDGSASATAANQANGAVAIGNDNKAVGQGSVALGNASTAGGAGAVALGDAATASASNGVAIGSGAKATNAGDVALGSGSTTSAAVAVSSATVNNVTYGGFAGSTPTSAVSIGSAGHERQLQNVAAGQITATSTDAVNGSQLYSVASEVGQINTSVSTLNNQVNQNTTNIQNLQNGSAGMFQVSADANTTAPTATGTKSTAGGDGAVASGNSSTALGNGAQATASNSVALGAGSVANRANSVSVGSAGNDRQITNVAAGTAADDAVNVSQLKATEAGVVQYDKNTDGSNNFSSVTLGGGSGSTTNTTIHNVAAGTATTDAVNVSQLNAGLTSVENWSKSYTDQQLSALNGSIDKVDNRASAGVAAAMAMAGLPQAYEPGKSMAAVAAGSFRGESSIAVGVSTISEGGRWVYKLTGSTDSRGDAGVTIGAGMQW